MTGENQTQLSDEVPTRKCVPCSYRGIYAQANTYCQVCSECLCDACEVVHRNSKASRDHELNTFEMSQELSIQRKALISSIMLCDIHRTETLTMFCVNHNTVECNVCKTLRHRNCETQTLKQVSKHESIKNELARYTKMTKALISEMKELSDSRQKDKDEIQACSSKYIQDVRRIKHQIIDWADKLANDMEDKITNAKKQILVEIERDIKATMELNKQMQRIENSFETLGQEIGETAFVLMMKEKGNIEDGIRVKEDFLKQAKRVTLEFQQTEKLVALMSELTSMGRLEVKKRHISKPETVEIRKHKLSFLEISSKTNKKIIHAGTKYVTGCTFMPDGELVICDEEHHSVKVFTPQFKLKTELKVGSRVWDVAAVSKSVVIVSEPDSKCLQFLNVSKNIEESKCIPIGMECWGVDCKNDKLYVSCHKDEGNGGVLQVLTMNGVIVSTFDISQGKPYYLAVNSFGDRILVRISSYAVLCIDITGNILYTYPDRRLGKNVGLLFHSYDNFMVCGADTDNIHVVKSDGTKHNILLTEIDGVFTPYCLAYRPSDDTLVIGHCPSPDSLLAFTIK